MEKHLLNIELRDTIIAEKLSAPITISEMVHEGHTGVVREDDFYDPLLAGDERAPDGNFNMSEDRVRWKEKKDAKFKVKQQ
mmetsp:Transcript_21821/g.33773  ORF Transcript_21821/g.33773 Transcript_21821/m.33773 type:complete len:81 (-) Transcript_21821:1726-1968(-)